MSCDGYTSEEKPISKWQKIALVVAFAAFILIMLFVEGCAHHQPAFCKGVGDLKACAYDTNDDGKIDAWQHWKFIGGEWVMVSHPIYIKRGK
jgi:hypothetical protein